MRAYLRDLGCSKEVEEAEGVAADDHVLIVELEAAARNWQQCALPLCESSAANKENIIQEI